MAYQYTTPELVQSEIQGASPFDNETFPSRDDIYNWIEEESSYINAISGRIFGSATVTDEFVDLSGDDDILLPVSPILSISKLEFNKNRIGHEDGPDWEDKTSAQDIEWLLYEDVGRIHIIRDNWNPKPGRRRVRISYTYGYADTPLTVRTLTSKLVAKRVIDSLLANKLFEGDTGEVSIGTMRVVEPRDLSVSAYRKLDEDIDKLKGRLHDGFRVFRPIVL